MIIYKRSTNIKYKSCSGIIRGSYSGVLTQDHFSDLGADFLVRSKGEKAGICDMSQCLLAFSDTPKPLIYSPGGWVGAVIVRPDQYETWQAYSLIVAKFGVIRMVFLESEQETAVKVLKRSLTLST